ncbi:hypothetical protein Q1695_013113 [Nippostrongylus brasiliensis]|nr:hypothetical protein Q1695_013113 [Nippostrongylus brasiliensis]
MRPTLLLFTIAVECNLLSMFLWNSLIVTTHAAQSSTRSPAKRKATPWLDARFRYERHLVNQTPHSVREPVSKQSNGRAKRKKREMFSHHAHESSYTLFFIVMGIVGGIICIILLVLIAQSIRSCQRRRREASMELARMGNEPRPIKSDDIRKERFKYRGPLKLDAGLKGEVKHLAPDNEECDPNMKVEFDQRLNEIVDIGTNIEVYEQSNTAKKHNERRISTARLQSKLMSPRPPVRERQKKKSKGPKRPWNAKLFSSDSRSPTTDHGSTLTARTSTNSDRAIENTQLASEQKDVEKATDTAPEKHSKSRERPIDSQYC